MYSLVTFDQINASMLNKSVAFKETNKKIVAMC